eukprot:361700-Chlamydomonas_euryale.AAC.7
MARQNVLGADHPNTLASANNLAALLKAMGELEDARELCRRVLAGCDKALWHDHPGTLACTVRGKCGSVGCEERRGRIIRARWRARWAENVWPVSDRATDLTMLP